MLGVVGVGAVVLELLSRSRVVVGLRGRFEAAHTCDGAARAAWTGAGRVAVEDLAAEALLVLAGVAALVEGGAAAVVGVFDGAVGAAAGVGLVAARAESLGSARQRWALRCRVLWPTPTG